MRSVEGVAGHESHHAILMRFPSTTCKQECLQTYKKACLLFSCILTCMAANKTPSSRKTKADLQRELEETRAALNLAQNQPVMFSTRIPKNIRDQIRDAAHTDGISVQDVVTEALQSWLDNRKSPTD